MASAGDMNVTFQGIPPETRAERRERIAVQMMAAISGSGEYHTFANQAHDAVGMAEALMAKLDEAAANDKQKGGE